MAKSNNNVQITVTTKDDGASRPFKELADAAKEASKAVKGVGEEAKKAKSAAGGGGRAGDMKMMDGGREGGGLLSGDNIKGAVQRVASVGGFGPLASMGAAGLMAFAAKDLGTAALNAKHSREFGGSPAGLQKEDAGIILRQIFATRDLFTGREFRERDADRKIERGQLETARDATIASQVSSLRDSLRAMTQSNAATGTSDEQLRRQLSNTDAQRIAVEARVRQSAIQGDSQQAFKREMLTAMDNSTGQARLDSLKNAMKAQAELVALGKQEIEDTNKVVGLLGQKRDLLQQNLAATAAGIKNQAAELGGMDRMSRMQATELGGKLRRGEELTPQEMEAAKGFGLLGNLVRERQAQEADKSGDLAKFLEAAGNEAEKKIAVEAQAKGLRVEAQIKVNEEELARELARQLEPLKMRLERVITRVANAAENQKNLDDARVAIKNALVE